jgi:hypothetical protein
MPYFFISSFSKHSPSSKSDAQKKDNALPQNKRTRTKTHNTRHRNILTDRKKAKTNASNAPQPKQVTREEEQQLTRDKKPTKNRIEERLRATAGGATNTNNNRITAMAGGRKRLLWARLRPSMDDHHREGSSHPTAHSNR